MRPSMDIIGANGCENMKITKIAQLYINKRGMVGKN